MATRLLIPKGRTTYYYRATFPRNLRHFLNGRAQLWRALGTDDVIEARKLADQWDLRVQRVLLDLKLQGERMTKAQIDHLVTQWLESSLDEAEDHRAVCGPVTDQYRDDVSLILSDQFEEVSEALISCDYRSVEAEADQLLQKSGVPALDHHAPAFGRLCRRLLIAKQEYLQIEGDRWEGRQYEPVRVSPHQHQQGGGSRYIQSQAAQPAGSPLYSVTVKSYLTENPRSPRTLGPVTVEFQKFIAIIGGDRPVAAITKAECRAYKENLIQVRKVKLATVTKHLTTLSGFFRWCEGQGYREDDTNPTRGLSPQNKFMRREALEHRPFTDAELVQVLSPRGGYKFAGRDFTKQRAAYPERYWVILLCLFQMCRLEEAAQLLVADIIDKDGLPCMRITDEGLDQGLKGYEKSRRMLPLHSSLIALGFLEYVKTIKAARHTRLFPQLTKGNGDGGFGTAVGKYFSRLVTHTGLTDPSLVLHSLRHGGITKLVSAGVPEDMRKVLTGHSAKDVHGKVYVHRELIPMTLLREHLEKLRYDEVVKALL